MDPQTDERTSVPEEPEEQQQLEAKVEPPLRRKPSRKVRRCRTQLSFSPHFSAVVTDLDRMHFNPKEENKKM